MMRPESQSRVYSAISVERSNSNTRRPTPNRERLSNPICGPGNLVMNRGPGLKDRFISRAAQLSYSKKPKAGVDTMSIKFPTPPHNKEETLHPSAVHDVEAGRVTGGILSNIPHNQEDVDNDLIFINVSGFTYVTTSTTLNRFPGTVLADEKKRGLYYSKKLNAYFFDRHRACFEAILQYYQTGIEYPPPYVDHETYLEEKEFFGMRKRESVIPKFERSKSKMNSQNCCNSTLKFKMHQFLQNPNSSLCASIYHIIDLIFITVSITLFVLETEPKLRPYFDMNPDPELEISNAAVYLFATNTVIMVWFTSDIVLRMATWPKFVNYWTSFTNILDIMSVLPFYIGLVQWGGDTTAGYFVLRVLRIVRVVRVFKFIRHSEDLMMIMKAVVAAKRELGILFIIIFLFIITFGSIMYYIEGDAIEKDGLPEHGPAQTFTSILASCWWVLVTISTVGFGDMYPVTVQGKIFGSFVLCIGIVCLALPMTIIVTKFSIVYDKEKV